MALLHRDNTYRALPQKDQGFIIKMIFRGGVGIGNQSRVALSSSRSAEYRVESCGSPGAR
jgi:hypothetical protein